jgi:hypothetical protein
MDFPPFANSPRSLANNFRIDRTAKNCGRYRCRRWSILFRPPGENVVEYATVCFRSQEDCGPVEKRSFEPGLPSNEFQDSHGNLACRSMLKPGRNDIRYDALVAVSSTPENQGAPGVLPVPVYELPAELLRYTLPSRPNGCI